MSDLSLAVGALESSDHPTGRTTQLPVSAYFDEALFEREQERIIRPGPRYLGHRLAVPERGDYFALAQEGEGRALVHGADGIQLVSNACRHRQAVMLKGRGNTGANIVCPLHRWTYGLDGKLLGAPHFDHDPCAHLNRWNLREWNGLLFEDNGRDIAADLASLQGAQDLSFDGYVLDKVQVNECAYNWKTFIEVYLEDYHVGPFHPGLGNFVTCEDLAWQWGDAFSVQTVGASRQLAPQGRAGSKVYQRWHDALLKFRGGEAPKQGSIWLTYYPTLMVEWYPHVLVVSNLYPVNPQKTLNVVEFYYPEEIAAFEREFVEAQQAAYMETCVEDDEIAERMDAGRRALMQRGDNEVGPYQSPMEDGMRHFHQWYRRTRVL
jgi:choline monooxygenase